MFATNVSTSIKISNKSAVNNRLNNNNQVPSKKEYKNQLVRRQHELNNINTRLTNKSESSINTSSGVSSSGSHSLFHHQYNHQHQQQHYHSNGFLKGNNIIGTYSTNTQHQPKDINFLKPQQHSHHNKYQETTNEIVGGILQEVVQNRSSLRNPSFENVSIMNKQQYPNNNHQHNHWRLRRAAGNSLAIQPPIVPMMIDDDEDDEDGQLEEEEVLDIDEVDLIDQDNNLSFTGDNNNNMRGFYNSNNNDNHHHHQSTALLLQQQQLQLQLDRDRRRRTKSISQVHAFGDDEEEEGEDDDMDDNGAGEVDEQYMNYNHRKIIQKSVGRPEQQQQQQQSDLAIIGGVDSVYRNDGRLNDFDFTGQQQYYDKQFTYLGHSQQAINYNQYHSFSYNQEPKQQQALEAAYYNPSASHTFIQQAYSTNKLVEGDNNNNNNFKSNNNLTNGKNNKKNFGAKQQTNKQIPSSTTTSDGLFQTRNNHNHLKQQQLTAVAVASKKMMQQSSGSRQHLTSAHSPSRQQQSHHQHQSNSKRKSGIQSSSSTRKHTTSKSNNNNKLKNNNNNNNNNGKHVEISCCGKLARILLFIANVLFWLAGIALGAWGILSLVDDHKYNLSQLLVFEPNSRTSLFQLLSWSFITLGCATILVGFCGCSAILKNNRWILGLYIFLILTIFALDLATGLLAIIFQERLVANVRLRLGNKLKNEYGVQASFTAAIDYIQTRYECCGLENHFDYDQSIWRLQRLGGFEATVARTCCHLRNTFDDQAHINPRPVNESMCQSTDSRFHQSYRYRKGCLDDLERLVRHKIWNFTIGCAAVGAIILLSLFFATCFCRSIPTGGSRKASSSDREEHDDYRLENQKQSFMNHHHHSSKAIHQHPSNVSIVANHIEAQHRQYK